MFIVHAIVLQMSKGWKASASWSPSMRVLAFQEYFRSLGVVLHALGKKVRAASGSKRW